MSGKIVVISKPDYNEHEGKNINALFDAGLDYYYLRMPKIEPTQLLALKQTINPTFFKQVIFHYSNKIIQPQWVHLHEDLRLHLTKEDIAQNYGEHMKLSTSIHNADSLYTLPIDYEFIFLSPVQQSISRKTDSYQLPQKWDAIKNNPQHQVYALGGINYTNAQHYINQGFKGIGVLGYIWKNADFISNFYRLKDAIGI